MPGMRLCDYPRGFGRVFGGGWKYMRKADEHLDNVCKGQFPKKPPPVFFIGKFHAYPIGKWVGGLPYFSLT